MNYTDDFQYPIITIPKRLVFTDEPNLPRKKSDANKARNRHLASLQKLIKRYKSWGLSLIPVEPKGKIPLIRWQQYQSRRADEGELNRWLSQHWGEGANLGIVCGKVSGNLVVLDFDTDSAWGKFFKWWGKHSSDDIYDVTPIVKTARGYHVYLRCRNTIKKRKPNSEVDIQGEGSFVVAPPSISQSGITYKFLNPDTRQILTINSLSEVGIATEAPSTSIETHRAPSNMANILNGVPEGSRHDSAVRLVGRWYAKGLNTQEVLNLLVMWNRRNSPPLSTQELDSIATSTRNWERSPKATPINDEDANRKIIRLLRRQIRDGR